MSVRIPALADRLTSLLQIRPGEARMAALAAALFAAIEAARGLGGNTADALFFLRFGAANLPYMYVALGVTSFFVTLTYTACLGRFAKRRFFAALLAALALALLAERAAILLDLRALYPILWLTVNIVGVLLGTLAWNVAGEVCDTRQAKRLFPIFVSAGIFGAFAGNLITGPAARLLGIENLLVVYAAILLIGLALIHRIGRDFFRSAVRGSAQTNLIADIRAGYDFMRRSRLLQLLAVSAVLFSMLFFSVTFPFGKAVSAAYPTEAEIAGFLGLFNGVASVVTFLVSLLVANRLYARIGVVNALLLLPVTYLAGFIVLAARFELATIALVRMAQWVVLSGIADGAYSTFFSVAPPDRRAQVRAFDAGVPSQVGILLSGVLLILGERVLSTSQIFVMGMVVAVACGLVVWRMHREYAQALIAALRAGRFDVFRAGERAFAGFQGDASAIQVAVRALSDPKPSVRRLGAAMLAEMRAVSAVPALVEKLHDLEAEVRIAALDALGELGAREAAGPVIALLDDREAAVRIRALRVLPDLQPPLTPELRATLEKHLRAADAHVQAQAAVALIRLDAGERAATLLEGLLRHSDPNCRVLGLETLGTASARRYTLPSGFGMSDSGLKLTVQNDETYRVRLVAAMLDDKAPRVRAAACKLLGQLQDESTLGSLSARLDDPGAGVRLAAAGALRQFGGRATAYVLPALKSDNPRAQNAALDALQLGDPAAFESVREVVYREAAQLREWEQLADGLPNTTRTARLLRQALEKHIAESQQRLVKMLGVFGQNDALAQVAQGLRARDPETRATAVEALELLGDKRLAKDIAPLLEHAAPRSVAAEPAPVIKRLIERQNGWTRLLAVQAAAELRLHDLAAEVRTLEQHPDPLTREVACSALAYLDRKEAATMETLQTVPLLERVLALREVPLFAELSPDDLKQIADIAHEEWYHDGQTLCREGEEGHKMFVIVAGEVSVVKGADQKLLAIRRSGDCIGEMAVIDSTPRMATVRAKGEVRALVIDGERFKAILLDRPEVALATLRTLSRRLRDAGD